MNRKITEQLFDTIADADERYIREYIDAQAKTPGHGRMKIRFAVILAAALIMLFGTISIAAISPVIGHFLANLRSGQQAVMQNFNEIQAEYAVYIDDTQKCEGVIGTLNSVILEDHHLILSYTFDWSGLEEAQDGSFHTYFLPWFFYITDGENIICQSEYTEGLHTQTHAGDTGEELSMVTHIYCIDLEHLDGKDLIGKELTVRLLYAEGGEGFSSTFTPETCFTDRNWNIDKTYNFDGHSLTLNKVQESALYITLFIDCDTIGHNEDAYAFILSDELGNDYTAYPNNNNTTDGYWFTKPEAIGTRLTLKIIQSHMESDQYGQITNDSYEVLYELPIELNFN